MIKNRKNIGSALLIIIVWVVISFTPISLWLESDIRLHMLIQLPLLAMLGYFLFRFLISGGLQSSSTDKIQPAHASVLIAFFATIYWMIPKSLDAALSYEFYALLKYLSIPMLIGVPLALGWHRVGAIFRGFMMIELLAMLLRLGWLYRESPIRLCSNYGLYEQNSLGNYLLLVALALGVYWSVKCFFPNKKYLVLKEK